MSDFRTRADEIKAAGEAARGDFTPDGVPKRMYQWWLANSPGKKAAAIASGSRRENFCHFWRVVVFWAPLLALMVTFLSAAEWVFDRVPGPVFGGILLAVFVIAGSTILTTTGNWIEFLQIMGMGIGFLLVIAGIVIGGAWLTEEFDWFLPAVLITILSAFVIFMLWAAFDSWGLAFFAWLAAALVAAGISGFGIFKLGEKIQAKRAYKKAQRAAAYEAQYEAYLNNEGPSPYERKVHTPSAFELKVAAFFSGIGDFLVLITQVVRVNKWKICPLVDVEPVERTPADF